MRPRTMMPDCSSVCTNLLFAKCVAGSWEKGHESMTKGTIAKCELDDFAVRQSRFRTPHGLGWTAWPHWVACLHRQRLGRIDTDISYSSKPPRGWQAGRAGKIGRKARVPPLTWSLGTCPDSSRTRFQATTLLFLG